jgi:hypothetical protein
MIRRASVEIEQYQGVRCRRSRRGQQGGSSGAAASELLTPFEKARAQIESLTLYMCWHGGTGHELPDDVMRAAARLRARHEGNSDEDYTSLTVCPSDADWRDFILVAPYCDWAYATDADGHLIAEVPVQR